MNEFSFTNINWLLLILFVPLIYVLYAFLYRKGGAFNQSVKAFADKHLLPHLIIKQSFFLNRKSKIIIWSILWILAALALSGPRFGYQEIETYEDSSALVILLDLSYSMNAQD